METLSSHYARLLGLNDSWRVESVDLQIEDRRVEIRLSHVGSGVFCPEYGEACGLADHADERRWRHLDTMQFTTDLVARLPRSRCGEHGVKTLTVEQRQEVRAVAADMLLAYANAVAQQLPNAELVHERNQRTTRP
jgi:transposase